MDIIKSFVVLLLRLFRNVLDYVSTLAFDWFYRGKQEKLPPIKDACLLEPAHVLAEKIRNREYRSEDVVRAYIRRIRQVQPYINAVVEDRFVEAVEEAQEVDRLLGEGGETVTEEEAPLLGVPVTIKEAIAVKGCLYTVGLAARRGVRAQSDSDVVTLLRRAGAIPIAVTITPELCFWWESYSTLHGRCSNPYDTTRTAGGSSGGEGAILGAGGSVIGVGNDIGGSIRIPASFNGIFGHKPTRGVVSNAGQYPTAAPALQSFLIAGPMCRYASDLLPMMKVMVSDHHRDRLKLDETVNLKDLKVYYMENEGGNPLISAVDPEILKAQKMVLDHLSSEHGLSPTKVTAVPHLRHCFEIWSKVLTASDLRPVDEEMTGRAGGRAPLFREALRWAAGASPHILPVLISAVAGRAWTPSDEKAAELYFRKMMDMEKFFEDMLKDNGIFVFPTGPDLALHHGHALLKPLGVSYTALFNLLGLPVSQCPVSRKQGLPVGLQVVGPHGGDRVTIAVAMEIERAFGGWVPPTPVEC